LETSKAEAHAA